MAMLNLESRRLTVGRAATGSDIVGNIALKVAPAGTPAPPVAGAVPAPPYIPGVVILICSARIFYSVRVRGIELDPAALFRKLWPVDDLCAAQEEQEAALAAEALAEAQAEQKDPRTT
jgi:hypothetical protein